MKEKKMHAQKVKVSHVFFTVLLLLLLATAGYAQTGSVTNKLLTFIIEFNDRVYDTAGNISYMVYGSTGKTVKTYFLETTYNHFHIQPAEIGLWYYQSDAGEVIGPLPNGTVIDYGFIVQKLNEGVIRVKIDCISPFGTGGQVTPPWSTNVNFHEDVFLAARKAADILMDFSIFDLNHDFTLDAAELGTLYLVACSVPGDNAATVAGGTHEALLDGVIVGQTFAAVAMYPHTQIGPLCHELGHHLLHLPDVYDGSGYTHGAGPHSLMGGGASRLEYEADGATPVHIDAWNKYRKGYISVQEIPWTSLINNTFHEIMLPPTASLNTGSKAVKIATSNPKEYFLIENRQFRGFEAGLQAEVNHPGLAIWHVDENVVNNHQGTYRLLDMVEANAYSLGVMPLDNKNIFTADEHYYHSGSQLNFGPNTFPGSYTHDGPFSGLRLTVGETLADGSVRIRINDPAANLSDKHEVQYVSELLTSLPPVDGKSTFEKDRRVRYRPVLAASIREAQAWKYTTQAPETGWESPAFNDTGWSDGYGGFGSDEYVHRNTLWLTSTIWLRKKFYLPVSAQTELEKLVLRLFHDGYVQVYINGVYAFSRGGWNDKYEPYTVSWAARNALLPGAENVIAVSCSDNGYPQFIDLGLYFDTLWNTGSPEFSDNMSMGGFKFFKGLAVNTNSELHYRLDRKYLNFEAEIGVDDKTSGGLVKFIVEADGEVLFETDPPLSGLPALQHPEAIKVNVYGKQELVLKAIDASGSSAVIAANWANARLSSLVTPLSDINWYQDTEQNGNGPVERDTSTGGPATADGATLSINGQKFSKGLGVHAPSRLRFRLDGEYARFIAYAGIDDQAPQTGSAVFKVYGDGEEIYNSGLMHYMDNAQKIDIPVQGKNYLELVVTDGGNGNSGDFADWADAYLVKKQLYISDLPLDLTHNGYGKAELDKTNGGAGSNDGNLLCINGKVYQKGIGVHADSVITVDLNLTGKKYSRFISDIGVDDSVKHDGSVVFQVLLDDIPVYNSGVMTGSEGAKKVEIELGEANTLKLIVTNGGDNHFSDHADWAGARLVY